MKQSDNSRLLWQKKIFKGFTAKRVKVTTESSPVSLKATVDGAANLPARNTGLPLCKACQTTSGRNFENFL